MTRMAIRFKAALVVCLMALLAGCSTLVPAPVPPPFATPVAGSPEASWARVLARFVNDRGEVDFPALAKDRSDLDRYVRYIADTPLEALSGDVKYAHMINAYNALSMFNVIESGIPQTHAGLNKVKFFILRKLPIGGKAMSLYAFENDVIRPFARQRGDPRVHFALNCSAVSCPVLPQRPFMPAAIDTELEREARAFFARRENFRIDPATRTVWLSEILQFYTEDFVPVHGANLIAYANRYAPVQAPVDYAVRFTPYDWTVANSRRKAATQDSPA